MMECSQGEQECPPNEEQRHRCVFSYDVDGDLRFISHHDTLRLFRRALARADLPVRYSSGFNPHPRLMIPLPRPVGIASEAELVVVEFDEPVDPADALRRLEAATPAALRMIDARQLEKGERLQPHEVRYQFYMGHAPPDDLAARVAQILASDVVHVERTNPKTGVKRQLDIRPYLMAVEIDGSTVAFTLRVTGAGTARPAEVAAVLGFHPDRVSHCIRRMSVQWQA